MLASTSSSTAPNANNKRPLGVTPASSNSPTGLSKMQPAKLTRDSRLGKYFDYDLSKMVNTKGGFLVEESEVDFDKLKEQERKRERERALKNVEPRAPFAFITFPRLIYRVLQPCLWTPG
jgi:DNA-repair protein complementing XP-A cells